jgi:hypothetical protein
MPGLTVLTSPPSQFAVNKGSPADVARLNKPEWLFVMACPEADMHQVTARFGCASFPAVTLTRFSLSV